MLTEAETVIKQLRDVQAGASEVSAERARCGLRLGLISVMLGDPESAIPSATEARSIFKMLREGRSRQEIRTPSWPGGIARRARPGLRGRLSAR